MRTLFAVGVSVLACACAPSVSSMGDAAPDDKTSAAPASDGATVAADASRDVEAATAVPDASPEVDAGPVTPTPDAAPDAPTAVPDAGNPVPVPVVDAGPPPPQPGDFVIQTYEQNGVASYSITLAYACGWSYTLKQICAQQIPGSTWGISTDCLTAGGESTGFYKSPWIIWNYQGRDPKILALSQSVAGGTPTADGFPVGGTINNAIFQASCIGGKMIMAGSINAPIGVWCCAQ
jgi:hypothetical protein